MNAYEKARKAQLRRLVDATIINMGSYSQTAVTAIMMIIAHESLKGTLREQIINFNADIDASYKATGKDYGRGICQMEKATHDDTRLNSDNIVSDFEKVFYGEYKNASCDRMVWDDKYSIFMARKKLHMIMEKIPSDLKEMSEYLSKYYNAGGKGSAPEYYNDYINW